MVVGKSDFKENPKSDPDLDLGFVNSIFNPHWSLTNYFQIHLFDLGDGWVKSEICVPFFCDRWIDKHTFIEAPFLELKNISRTNMLRNVLDFVE